MRAVGSSSGLYPVRRRTLAVNPAAIPAGGPYTLTVQDENSSVHITDVMIGEVWLAARAIQHGAADICGRRRIDPCGRRCQQPHSFFHRSPPYQAGLHRSPAGILEVWLPVDTGWSVCTEETMLHFSAIGAFFAQLLEQAEQIPVGIISCNFGGSGIEAWIPREHILTHPALQKAQEQYNTCLGTLDLKTYERQYAEFQKAMEASAGRGTHSAFLEEYGPSAFARKERSDAGGIRFRPLTGRAAWGALSECGTKGYSLFHPGYIVVSGGKQCRRLGKL